MEYFVDFSGNKVSPQFTGDRAECPCCGGTLIAACGSIVSHHWRHESGYDCDSWSEGMTQWHIDWQSYMEKRFMARCEVWIKKNGIMHRADAVLPDGTVVEIQHSSISVEEIRERELFYGKMAWLFDARDAGRCDRLHEFEGKFWNIRWNRPRKTLAGVKRDLFLDAGYICEDRDRFECECGCEDEDVGSLKAPTCEIWKIDKFRIYGGSRLYGRASFIRAWEMFREAPRKAQAQLWASDYRNATGAGYNHPVPK